MHNRGQGKGRFTMECKASLVASGMSLFKSVVSATAFMPFHISHKIVSFCAGRKRPQICRNVHLGVCLVWHCDERLFFLALFFKGEDEGDEQRGSYSADPLPWGARSRRASQMRSGVTEVEPTVQWAFVKKDLLSVLASILAIHLGTNFTFSLTQNCLSKASNK